MWFLIYYYINGYLIVTYHSSEASTPVPHFLVSYWFPRLWVFFQGLSMSENSGGMTNALIFNNVRAKLQKILSFKTGRIKSDIQLQKKLFYLLHWFALFASNVTKFAFVVCQSRGLPKLKLSIPEMINSLKVCFYCIS